jgi:hypothetical protein
VSRIIYPYSLENMGRGPPRKGWVFFIEVPVGPNHITNI